MDTIVSGVHGKGGLLVLIERKTRYYLIAKLRTITQAEVLRALRQLGHVVTRLFLQPFVFHAKLNA